MWVSFIILFILCEFWSNSVHDTVAVRCLYYLRITCKVCFSIQRYHRYELVSPNSPWDPLLLHFLQVQGSPQTLACDALSSATSETLFRLTFLNAKWWCQSLQNPTQDAHILVMLSASPLVEMIEQQLYSLTSFQPTTKTNLVN